MIEYWKGHELVEMVDELGICGCGRPHEVYKLIHIIMKAISKHGVKINQSITYEPWPAYHAFVIYQLNKMEFLEHGSSIYGSWLTEKGKKLIEALNEMEKYDYEYEDFYNNNLSLVEKGDQQ